MYRDSRLAKATSVHQARTQACTSGSVDAKGRQKSPESASRLEALAAEAAMMCLSHLAARDDVAGSDAAAHALLALVKACFECAQRTFCRRLLGSPILTPLPRHVFRVFSLLRVDGFIAHLLEQLPVSEARLTLSVSSQSALVRCHLVASTAHRSDFSPVATLSLLHKCGLALVINEAVEAANAAPRLLLAVVEERDTSRRGEFAHLMAKVPATEALLIALLSRVSLSNPTSEVVPIVEALPALKVLEWLARYITEKPAMGEGPIPTLAVQIALMTLVLDDCSHRPPSIRHAIVKAAKGCAVSFCDRSLQQRRAALLLGEACVPRFLLQLLKESSHCDGFSFKALQALCNGMIRCQDMPVCRALWVQEICRSGGLDALLRLLVQLSGPSLARLSLTVRSGGLVTCQMKTEAAVGPPLGDPNWSLGIGVSVTSREGTLSGLASSGKTQAEGLCRALALVLVQEDGPMDVKEVVQARFVETLRCGIRSPTAEHVLRALAHLHLEQLARRALCPVSLLVELCDFVLAASTQGPFTSPLNVLYDAAKASAVAFCDDILSSAVSPGEELPLVREARVARLLMQALRETTQLDATSSFAIQALATGMALGEKYNPNETTANAVWAHEIIAPGNLETLLSFLARLGDPPPVRLSVQAARPVVCSILVVPITGPLSGDRWTLPFLLPPGRRIVVTNPGDLSFQRCESKLAYTAFELTRSSGAFNAFSRRPVIAQLVNLLQPGRLLRRGANVTTDKKTSGQDNVTTMIQSYTIYPSSPWTHNVFPSPMPRLSTGMFRGECSTSEPFQ